MNKIILIVDDDAWEILEETLLADSHSANFDRKLREQISNALGTVEYPDFASDEEIRRARDEYGSDVINIDAFADTSRSEDPSDPGLWVRAWVWLSGQAD